MTPNTPPADDPLPEWLDPFPQPRTMPDGWDLRGLLEAAPAPAAGEDHVPGADDRADA